MPYRAKIHNPMTPHQQAQLVRARAREERMHDMHARLYKLAEWRDPVIGMRIRRLREEPTCRECRAERRVSAATDVDHVIPHKGSIALFMDYENTQSLCHSHHSIKTVKENQK